MLSLYTIWWIQNFPRAYGRLCTCYGLCVKNGFYEKNTEFSGDFHIWTIIFYKFRLFIYSCCLYTQFSIIKNVQERMESYALMQHIVWKIGFFKQFTDFSHYMLHKCITFYMLLDIFYYAALCIKATKNRWTI